MAPMTTPTVRDHLDDLVTVVDGRAHLVGSRCSLCATDTFPAQASCPKCGSDAVAPVTLPTEGAVWTWTIQRHPPKPPFRAPASFEPYALAYVDLGTVLVESRLAGKAADAWRIGDVVQLVVGPLDPDVPDWRAFWFEPQQGGV